MNQPKIKLLGDVVAVKEIPESRVSPAGLSLPDQAIQNQIKAEVIHVGSKCKMPELHVGSKVLVSIYDCSETSLYKSLNLRVYPSNKILALLD